MWLVHHCGFVCSSPKMLFHHVANESRAGCRRDKFYEVVNFGARYDAQFYSLCYSSGVGAEMRRGGRIPVPILFRDKRMSPLSNISRAMTLILFCSAMVLFADEDAPSNQGQL
jgi:hypothetical protein